MIEFEVGQFSWTTRTFSYSLLLFYFFLTFSTTAEYDSRDVGSISNDRTQDNDFHSCTEGKCIKRTTQEISSGMWFGPRLGKRQKLESPTEMDTELEAVANTLDNSRWDILALPADKKRITGVKINQEEGDYDDDRIISKLIILEDPRKDDPFSKKSFYLSTNRGNDRVLPWTISSRFPHRTRRFSTMS